MWILTNSESLAVDGRPRCDRADAPAFETLSEAVAAAGADVCVFAGPLEQSTDAIIDAMGAKVPVVVVTGAAVAEAGSLPAGRISRAGRMTRAGRIIDFATAMRRVEEEMYV